MTSTNHREIAHVRQDLAVAKEILAILNEEKSRLTAVADERACEIARLNEEVEECRRLFQGQRHAYELEVNRLKECVASLDAELSEALSERRRLSELLRSIRGQVDGRLTKQVEQLQQRDEMIHRLEYEKRECEREIERLNKVAKTEATKLLELENSQEAHSHVVSAELANLREQIGQYKVELAAAHERNHQETSSKIENIHASHICEVISMFFLYRNWLTEVNHSMNTVEDKLEDSLSKGIDSLALMTSCGLPYNPPHLERKRFREMKKVERERIKGEMTVHQDSAGSYEDSFALAVYSVRRVWDSVKHSIEKVKVVSQQLEEIMNDVLDASQKTHDGVPNSQPLEEPKDVAAAYVETKGQPSQIFTQCFEEDIRRKDSEITRLKLSLSELNEQYSLLQNRLLKGSEDIENISLHNSTKIKELEERHQRAMKYAEEVAEQKLCDIQHKYEMKVRCLEEESASLRNSSNEQNARMDKMKNMLLESKKRRVSIKEENVVLKKQLQSAEDLVNSLRIELVGTKRTIELLQVELQQKDFTDKNRGSSGSSQQFRAFKRELKQLPHDRRTVFLSRPS